MDYIYALYSEQPAGREYFYVGRTIDPDRRLKEHRYGERTGHESKYQFARALTACQCSWDMEVLQFCGPGTDRFEDFYVYTLTLDGHPLQNERKGDSKARAEEDAASVFRQRRQRFATPDEFLAARDREVQEAEARRKASKTRNAAFKQASGHLGSEVEEKTLFVGEKAHERFMSPWMRERLTKLGRTK